MNIAHRKLREYHYTRALLGLVTGIVLLLSACLQAKGDGVMATVEVRNALDQKEGQYSLQEDVLLQVQLINQDSKGIDTPYLKQSNNVFLRLKGPGPNQLTELATLVPKPGIMTPSDIYSLAAGQEISYDLRLSDWFGPLLAGNYEVQIEISSQSMAHTSGWLAFEIAAASFSEPAMVPAASGENTELSLLWLDTNTDPARMLCRVYELGHSANVLTTRIAEVSPDSKDLTASMAPAGMWGEFQWIVWIEGQNLNYAIKNDRSLGPVFQSQMAGAMTIVGPALCSPDPATDETGFSQLLRSEDGTELQGLEIDPQGVVIANHRVNLVFAGSLFTLSYSSSDNRQVVWVQTDSQGESTVQAISWNTRRGFGDQVEIGEIESPVRALAARIEKDQGSIAALVVNDNSGSLGVKKRTASLITFTSAASFETAGKWEKAAQKMSHGLNVMDVHLVISENGSPWMVLRDPQGQKVVGLVGESFTEPFSIEGVKVDAWVTVDENELPQVILLDQSTGWEVRVAVPNAGAH